MEERLALAPGTVNYCNVMLYRNNKDHLGLHRDNALPSDVSGDFLVCTVSLGAERSYELHTGRGKDAQVMKVLLKAGSLNALGPVANAEHLHCMPQGKKRKSAPGVRLSINFRHVG